jgi:hypothetical protein
LLQLTRLLPQLLLLLVGLLRGHQLSLRGTRGHVWDDAVE